MIWIVSQRRVHGDTCAFILEMQSNALIQELLRAEEEAEAIVSRARENRNKRLKEASDSAESELKQFRALEEKRHQAEFGETIDMDQIGAEYYKQSQKEINELITECSNNYDTVVKFLVDGVSQKVDHSLSEIAVRSLKGEMTKSK
eukprot:GDKK01057361.1.p1 GENE.GDKK01057361.1~~GDKK01057361.1.p1  ORF type:complete len:146 (-),score=47.32 GDKK01057361.1:136-573(-)